MRVNDVPQALRTSAVSRHTPLCCNSRVSKFVPAQRLVHKTQFDAVYKRGTKLGDSCFLVLIKPNEASFARLGLSVSARTVGNAVNRNRIKRVIRNSFRLYAAQLPAVDIVVNTRSGARDALNSALTERLARHWQNVVKRCAVS